MVASNRRNTPVERRYARMNSAYSRGNGIDLARKPALKGVRPASMTAQKLDQQKGKRGGFHDVRLTAPVSGSAPAFYPAPS
jgi:hypothetical protein